MSKQDENLRGLGLRTTPCGILTRNANRNRHKWVVIIHEEYGEDYNAATLRGLELAQQGKHVYLINANIKQGKQPKRKMNLWRLLMLWISNRFAMLKEKGQ